MNPPSISAADAAKIRAYIGRKTVVYSAGTPPVATTVYLANPRTDLHNATNFARSGIVEYSFSAGGKTWFYVPAVTHPFEGTARLSDKAIKYAGGIVVDWPYTKVGQLDTWATMDIGRHGGVFAYDPKYTLVGPGARNSAFAYTPGTGGPLKGIIGGLATIGGFLSPAIFSIVALGAAPAAAGGGSVIGSNVGNAAVESISSSTFVGSNVIEQYAAVGAIPGIQGSGTLVLDASAVGVGSVGTFPSTNTPPAHVGDTDFLTSLKESTSPANIGTNVGKAVTGAATSKLVSSLIPSNAGSGAEARAPTVAVVATTGTSALERWGLILGIIASVVTILLFFSLRG